MSALDKIEAETRGVDVSLIQLIANPEKFDRTKIRVQGYLYGSIEHYALYLSVTDVDYSVTENAMWIDFTENLADSEKREEVKPWSMNTRYVHLWANSTPATVVSNEWRNQP